MSQQQQQQRPYSELNNNNSLPTSYPQVQDNVDFLQFDRTVTQQQQSMVQIQKPVSPPSTDSLAVANVQSPPRSLEPKPASQEQIPMTNDLNPIAMVQQQVSALKEQMVQQTNAFMNMQIQQQVQMQLQAFEQRQRLEQDTLKKALMQANQQIDSLKSFIEKLDSRLSTLETTTLEIFRNQLSQSEEREREKMRERSKSQIEEDERLAKQLQEQLSAPSSVSSSSSSTVKASSSSSSSSASDEKMYSCPVCGEKFPLYDQRTIEVHTNAHFDENEVLEYNKRRAQQAASRQPTKSGSPNDEPGFFDKLFGAKKPTQPTPAPSSSSKLSQSQGGVPSSSPPHTFTQQQPQMPMMPIGPLPTGSRLVSSAFPGQPIMYGVMPSNYYTYPYPLPQQPPQYADNANQSPSNSNANPPQYL